VLAADAAANTTTDTEIPAITFLQRGTLVAGSDRETLPGITCFNCQKRGHCSTSCPEAVPDATDAAPPADDAVQLLQAHDAEDEAYEDIGPSDFTFLQSGDNEGRLSMIPDTWVLLDSQSTVSVFRNPAFSQISKRRKETTSKCTRMVDLRYQRWLEVWYNNECLANILSLAEV